MQKGFRAMETQFGELANAALEEIRTVFRRTAPDAADRLAREILAASAIHCYALGREALMLRAFCMRLMHLGFDAHWIGDVTAPPAAPGQLVIVASGPGDILMNRSMIQLGQRAGARVLVVTAQPDGPDPKLADVVVMLPAQSMADDAGSARVLPMGTAFEIAMLIFSDLTAIRLQTMTGQSNDDLRARHTNLE
jgi:6-phospho-3-hexuloisomerase